ncbi:GTP-binding protein [Planktothrix agardhii]|uniref:CobW C-terminal domain-containing protein n=1 Tax=Planktothrix agardhii (strain NIVA-CYA 126/8) TaxID=388467 RepID=A0A073CM15_PLAA1|nr:GTP-binding protein [Planktothrix agardhii]AQY60367.1 hypothetical protein [Planktothrix agardhii NIVA-CYA 126/8]KEI68758.1 hypothetical protein A19Y_4046 [Planktothrix agardhii NIVA-CYA 126/8]CAD5969889.1 hypothetical protein NIVACYA_04192 [Planktothrix agardhii]
MNQPVIMAVAGRAGVGKTTWIRQQIATESLPVLYFSPGTGSVPIDQTCISAEFPQVKTLNDAKKSLLTKHLINGSVAYIELGYYLQLDALNSLLEAFPSRRVCIVPPNTKDSEWQNWADETVEGVSINQQGEQLSIWRLPLQGNVIDPGSLDVFWYQEMTEGAYGKIHRAKGIFDIADGRSFYLDFVAELAETKYEELNLPLWLKGKPQRFSGIEIIGENLDETSLLQTLEDSCLSEAVILYYQQQVKDSMSLSAEEETT